MMMMMTTRAIVKTEEVLAGTSAGMSMNWSEEDVRLIRATVAKEANDSEFKLFLYTARRYHLDPLVKQIFCVKYGSNPAAIFTSRDGFLSIAHRSGQFDGMETRAIRTEKGSLAAAICTVWRKDMTHPFVVEVTLSEYYNDRNANWKARPETMLKKVAESQALRRAFDVSGLYEPAEYEPERDREQGQERRPVHTQPRPVATGQRLPPALAQSSRPAQQPVQAARVSEVQPEREPEPEPEPEPGEEEEDPFADFQPSPKLWAKIEYKEFEEAVVEVTNGLRPKQAAEKMGLNGMQGLSDEAKARYPEYVDLAQEQKFSVALKLIEEYFHANPEDK